MNHHNLTRKLTELAITAEKFGGNPEEKKNQDTLISLYPDDIFVHTAQRAPMCSCDTESVWGAVTGKASRREVKGPTSLSTWEPRQIKLWEFEASLVYRVSSMTVKATIEPQSQVRGEGGHGAESLHLLYNQPYHFPLPY